jgi:hypothetical protein
LPSVVPAVNEPTVLATSWTLAIDEEVAVPSGVLTAPVVARIAIIPPVASEALRTNRSTNANTTPSPAQEMWDVVFARDVDRLWWVELTKGRAVRSDRCRRARRESWYSGEHRGHWRCPVGRRRLSVLPLSSPGAYGAHGAHGAQRRNHWGWRETHPHLHSLLYSDA